MSIPVSGRYFDSPAEWHRYIAALTGSIPGQELPMGDRYHLIRDLHAIGWSDALIADHTSGTLSSITAARIRLGLPDNGGDR